MRKAMVDPENQELSIRRQCELLGIDRNRLQRREVDLDEEELAMARRLDELHLRFPDFGARRTSQWLLREGRPGVTRRRVGKVMKRTGELGSGVKNQIIPADIQDLTPDPMP